MNGPNDANGGPRVNSDGFCAHQRLRSCGYRGGNKSRAPAADCASWPRRCRRIFGRRDRSRTRDQARLWRPNMTVVEPEAASHMPFETGFADALAEGNPWFPKLPPAKRNEIVKFAVRHIGNNSPLFELTKNGGDYSTYQRLAVAIARSGIEEAENIFVEAALSAKDADPEEELRRFYQSCNTGSSDQDNITAGTIINKARELGADFSQWEHVAEVPTSQALYVPGNEQKCRELLDQAVAADGQTFTLGDRSGPLIILRKPDQDALPSDTFWDEDLPGATLATPADIVMRAERLQWYQRAGGNSESHYRRTLVPRGFAKEYLEQMRGQYAASPFRGIVRVPRIDGHGVIHFTPGYDRQTGLFHDSVPGFFVPSAPTLDRARQAAEALLVPFSKYQFDNVQVGHAPAAAPPRSVMNSRRLMSDPKLRRQSYRLKRVLLIGAETDIKNVAAVHNQCLCWVKTGKAQLEHMFSALPPIPDIAQ
jgi:hypothetical protein